MCRKLCSYRVIVRAGGAIWLNPLATVLFNVCSDVTVELFFTCVVWVCFLLCKEEGSSPVSAITERMDMCQYEVPLSVSLLGFGMGKKLANFHM